MRFLKIGVFGQTLHSLTIRTAIFSNGNLRVRIKSLSETLKKLTKFLSAIIKLRKLFNSEIIFKFTSNIGCIGFKIRDRKSVV